jgi:hypothetical protein
MVKNAFIKTRIWLGTKLKVLSRTLLPGYRESSIVSEGTSAKWIFDIEIEKLRADFFFVHVEKTKIVLGVRGKFLIYRLRPTFYYFISNFPIWLFIIFS